MAALVQGVQYGLSSQGNVCDNNKSLIFVKLTDSAYRAIEDFLKNKNKLNKPTIQFLGDEGTITIPTCEPSHGQSRFQFSLSSSADIEGPQGSFECVHQNGPRTLESLGTLPCKMRIHAKEDVYETTRTRMAKVEEIKNQNCTREIKPGGIGFGKKTSLSRSPTGRNLSVLQRREQDLPNLNSSSSAPANKQIPSNVKPSINGYLPSHHTVINGSANSIHSRPLNNGHSQKTGNPDIMRRPIRERLVHLLAVRPYKRPELYDRMNKDGLRDRDKKCLGDVLKQIAIMRENTYHLIRHIWNDVQEDWPFYSEQEKQLLKRRKPQNLTPPGSSDGGSSGSGQSPTSTHPGSPPPPVASGLKRPGYSEGSDGLLTKKPRISHYRKPDPPQPTYRETSNGSVTSTFRFPSSAENEENDGKRSVIENVGSNCVGSVVLSKDKLTRCDNVQKTNISYPYQSFVSNTSNCGNTSYNSTISSSSSSSNNNNKTSREETPWPKSNKGVLGPSPSSRSHGGHHDNRNGRCHDSNGNSSSPLNRISTSSIQRPEQSSVNRGSSPNSLSENLDQIEADSSDERDVSSTFPDYLTSYTTILNSEQRSNYKADFNADYSEYRRLHADVERVSQRFAFLEQSLKQEERHSAAWRNIQRQIVKEYEENKRDHRHQEIKRRFQYLHDKLSHIKRLVLEYDSAPTSTHY